MNFTIDSTLIALAILVVAVLVLVGIVVHMHIKLKRFMSMSVPGTLSTSVENLEAFRDELKEYLATVEKRLKKSVQAVHTVRFNPFKGTGSGSNQSFATVFLNEEGHGVVISSLYSREHVSIFSKPIKSAGSEYELSGEEKEAIAVAHRMTR
ncbi:MAG: DUF4446 family protein [Patescibacteria group bacterium]